MECLRAIRRWFRGYQPAELPKPSVLLAGDNVEVTYSSDGETVDIKASGFGYAVTIVKISRKFAGYEARDGGVYHSDLGLTTLGTVTRNGVTTTIEWFTLGSQEIENKYYLTFNGPGVVMRCYVTPFKTGAATVFG